MTIHTMSENTPMAELVQLSYPEESKPTVHEENDKETCYKDLQRLMQGISFPHDQPDGIDEDRFKEFLVVTPVEIPNRCKNCKRVDCVGVCEYI